MCHNVPQCATMCHNVPQCATMCMIMLHIKKQCQIVLHVFNSEGYKSRLRVYGLEQLKELKIGTWFMQSILSNICSLRIYLMQSALHVLCITFCRTSFGHTREYSNGYFHLTVCLTTWIQRYRRVKLLLYK